MHSCVLLIFLAGFIGGCSDEKSEQPPAKEQVNTLLDRDPEFSSVLPQRAQELVLNNPNILIVDVRTPAEREQVRMADSVPVPLGDILGGRADLPRDKPLMLVCAVGGRSYAAGLYLMKQDYRLVYNLRGGISAWEKAGLPLEYTQK